MKKNRKPLIALVLVAIIGVVGGTIAYFSNYAVFENIFHTDKFEQEIEEKFVSPSDWRPGDTTEKKLEVTNTGTRPVKVAVEVYQEWESGNGDGLNPWGVRWSYEKPIKYIFDESETCPEYTEKYIFPPPYLLEERRPIGACYPVRSSAILNLANGEDWSHYYEYTYDKVGEGNGTYDEVYNEETGRYEYIEAEGGSYVKDEYPYLQYEGLFVYNKELGAGETTTSFLDSVTFNPYAVSDSEGGYVDGLVCDTYYVMEDGTEVLKPEPKNTSSETTVQATDFDMSKVVGQKSKCHSTGDGYSGATYSLYFVVHIMQPEVFDEFVKYKIDDLLFFEE